jgi:hypothetical protein
MGGDDFFKTRMGHRFYEATMPKIAERPRRGLRLSFLGLR